MKKIKRLLALLLATMMVVSLAACGGAGGNAKAGEEVVLTMYGNVAASKESLAAFEEEVVKVFEAENPGTKVDIVLTEDPTGLATQQIAAGGGPDILTVEPTNVQLFAEAGYLQSLNEYAKEYGWYDLFDEWALGMTSQGDSLYALPDAVEGLAVFYNKDMFAEKGWEVPTNYQEYIDLCEAIKAEGIIPNAFGNSDFKMANQWWISMGYTAALGHDNFHDLLQGKLAWESDEMKDATDKLASMWEKGYIYENSAGITLEDARNLLINRQAAMMMSGQWDVFELMNAEPEFEWGSFKMPSWQEDGGEGALPVALGGAYSVNKNCKNPDMAAKFLTYIYADDVVLGEIGRGTLFPTSNCDPSKVADLDSHYVEVYDILLDAMESNNVGYCTWTYWPPATDTYAWNNLESLYLGQVSRDEYLKNLQEKYDEDVANGSVLEF